MSRAVTLVRPCFGLECALIGSGSGWLELGQILVRLWHIESLARVRFVSGQALVQSAVGPFASDRAFTFSYINLLSVDIIELRLVSMGGSLG